MTMPAIVPVLRSFDEAKMRSFYLDFLGFSLDWQHRFAPELPLYVQLSRGYWVLHLSEHHGDACPGATLRLSTQRLDELHGDLLAKAYGNARPGIETMPWGSREMTIWDPFGNKFIFNEPLSE
ncbi:putative glyoxalase superfamily protein PhnB [Aeromonas sp. BIGb0405]|uniref:VOC family protein n=1 Tax=Aeromonas sp. BIGb0405 TaxID=2940592 RepID=UPI00216988D6|nr:VOC family protein [Aeromonas sp. BIGb0405]MCS3454480.1 putative glyoxalase superfamily protein PhnB [Aeromonas sp. BIGb0405]